MHAPYLCDHFPECGCHSCAEHIIQLDVSEGQPHMEVDFVCFYRLHYTPDSSETPVDSPQLEGVSSPAV